MIRDKRLLRLPLLASKTNKGEIKLFKETMSWENALKADTEILHLMGRA